MRARTGVTVGIGILFAGALLMVLSPLYTFALEMQQPPGVIMEEEAPEIPPVVAIVEGEEITGEEFQRAMMTAMQMKAARSAQDPNRDPSQPPEEFGRADAQQVLQNLIQTKAVFALAKKADTQVSDAELTEEIEEIKARFPQGQFEQILQAQGLTEARLRDSLREQLKAQKFFEEKTKDVTVLEEDVQGMYEELKAAGQMEKPETVDVAHILIAAPRGGAEEDIAEAKERIDAARKRIVEDEEDFGEVAKDVSEDPGSAPRGGLYEGVPRGQMVPEFEQRMFDLPIGEVSQPFQTQFGWHILEVEGRDEAGTAEYDEVKDRIREILEQQAKGEAFSEYLEAAIRELDIEIFLPAREGAGDPLAPVPEIGEIMPDDGELPDEPA